MKTKPKTGERVIATGPSCMNLHAKGKRGVVVYEEDGMFDNSVGVKWDDGQENSMPIKNLKRLVKKKRMLAPMGPVGALTNDPVVSEPPHPLSGYRVFIWAEDLAQAKVLGRNGMSKCNTASIYVVSASCKMDAKELSPEWVEVPRVGR